MSTNLTLEPQPRIRVRYIDSLAVAEWDDPWTGRRRSASSMQGAKDAEEKARAAIRLEWQRREEDRLTYGGERPSRVARELA